MAYQSVFKRYELKYILTKEQVCAVQAAMELHMKPDAYGVTTVRNLYFDTDDYRLIRHSIEKPVYKEKLRVRSYRQTAPSEPVFVELKKKYKSVVYKRRMAIPQQQALGWLAGGDSPQDCQIAREIDYFTRLYGGVHPRVFLSYDRQAYYSTDGWDLRVTFDTDVLCRREALSLEEPVWGTALLPPDLTLMELKTPGGIPLWMTQVLTRERIRKVSFSKYGTAYRTMIFKGDCQYA